MRRNAVRSIGVDACLFDQKELEQLYAVFKVCPLDVILYSVHDKDNFFTRAEGNKVLLFSVNTICLRCPFKQRTKSTCSVHIF